MKKTPAMSGFFLRPIVLATSLLAAHHALAVGPGAIVHGSGSVVRDGAVTTVNQKTDKMVVYWGNMDVAPNETLNFAQPSKTAAVLNRVVGTDPTQILGALNASGRVFVVNPNGILIGNQAKVNVGSLVASSLNVSDYDFMAGRLNFSGTSQGKVVNEGRIDAGESVALIGAHVANRGTIHSQRGSVVLAAADGISLAFAGNGLQVKLTRGSLQALVENGGMIVSDNGDVMLSAWARDALTRAVVNQTGKIEAGGMGQLRGIRIASEGNGTVTVGGDVRLTGSAANGMERSIDVSAQGIRIADGARVDTAGGQDSIKLHTRAQAGAAGHVTFGDATLKAGYVDIVADNVLTAAASAGLPTFVADAVMLSAQNAKAGYVLNRAPDAQAMSTLAAGTGSVSNGFLKAAGEQNLWILSQGTVSALGAVNASALSIAGNADVDLSGGFNGKQLAVWGNSIKLAGTTQADAVSLAANDIALDGVVGASRLDVDGYVRAQTTDRTALRADTASLAGGQIDFSRGAHTLKHVDINANGARLSLAGDTTIGRAKSLSELTLRSQGKLVADMLDARGNVDVVARGDASLGKVSGNSVTLRSTDGKTAYTRLDAKSGASIDGARGVDAGQTNASSLTLASDGDVRIGSDLSIRGPVDISGRNVTAAVVRDGDTQRLSARAHISTSDDVRVAAKGNAALGNVSGQTVALSAGEQLDVASVVGERGATLDGKGGLSLRRAEATFGALMLNSDGRIRYSGPLVANGAMSVQGGEVLAVRDSRQPAPVIIGSGGITIHGVHGVDLFAVHAVGGDLRVTSGGGIRFTGDLWAHGGSSTVQGKRVTAVSNPNDSHRPGIYATGDVSISADSAPNLGKVYSRDGAVRVTLPAQSTPTPATGDA
ncbi:filamentous hemagglutinin N-terminal domain-containing protein [Burkholderia ubonensis]|uniref:two-partner secretion domain-containing protein n=1 Tax=Burkholderia ubonensis TaxID=101571 RepID=UPI0012F82223|nr:filamentous hemagglutinin N-terminal domain-containing protein [Burkholderia ubonensis]